MNGAHHSVHDTSQRELVRTIVACVADGVLVVDDAGLIRFANPAAGALFGRDEDALVGTEFGFPIAAEERTEIDIVRRGGKLVTAELRISEAAWEGEHVLLVSLRDITARREIEEAGRQLALAQAARVQAEELSQAKTDFIAVMSHELRTPLNAVLGYTELIDHGVTGPVNDAQRAHLQRVIMNARHLLRLVNEILDFSTIEAGQLPVDCKPHPAAEVADMACEIVQELAERQKLEVTRRYDAERHQRYVGDEKRTRQVLVNLLSNSLRFTNPPGEIAMEIVETGKAPSDVVPPSVSGRWVGFRVNDTGIGIPDDQHETVFAPFTQLDTGRTRSRDGTGLGLPISRRLARLMGGDVTVESTPRAGSTFTLWLPSAAE